MIPFREKAKEVFQNYPKIIEIFLPHVISIIGVTLWNWSIPQIFLLYYIDLFFDYLTSVIKMALNTNPQSLEDVYINITKLNKHQRTKFTGTLTGLKVRAIAFYSYMVLFFIAWSFWLLFILALGTHITSILIASASLLVTYIYELVVFWNNKEHRVSLIGDYFYSRAYYKLINLASLIALSLLFLFIFTSFILIITQFWSVHMPDSVYRTIPLLIFALGAIPNAIHREYVLLKKRETPGMTIIKYLQKHAIPFQILLESYESSPEATLEAKLVKYEEYKYCLVIQDQVTPFSENILNEKLDLKRARWCTTDECVEITGYKLAQLPPFRALYGFNSYVNEHITKQEYIFIDLKKAGKIKLATKDYLALEKPEYFS
jgi:prolyl-tRNA editing enzyme YbaK/EbsC (Cys-tRNA(Pro) deacylase)